MYTAEEYIMFYTVYKITNKINEKIYIGCHKTKNINDDYMGSGTLLKSAKNKYGIENFEKEILYIFDNAEQMFEMESQLVDEAFIKRRDTYNIKKGGSGGFDYLNNNPNYVNPTHQFEHIQKMSNKGVVNRLKKLELMRQDVLWWEECKKKIRKSVLSLYANGYTNPFKDKKHTDSTKKLIGSKNAVHQVGEGNSQYNTRWIYHPGLKISKKISKAEDLPPGGWLEGRKIKF